MKSEHGRELFGKSKDRIYHRVDKIETQNIENDDPLQLKVVVELVPQPEAGTLEHNQETHTAEEADVPTGVTGKGQPEQFDISGSPGKSIELSSKRVTFTDRIMKSPERKPAQNIRGIQDKDSPGKSLVIADTGSESGHC